MKAIKNETSFIYPRKGSILEAVNDETFRITVSGVEKCHNKCETCLSAYMCIVDTHLQRYCLGYQLAGKDFYVWKYHHEGGTHETD